MIVTTILDVLILLFSSIAILISSTILFLTVRRRHQFSLNSSTLLLCNTYLSIIFTCLALFDTFIWNLYNILHEQASSNNWWCYTRAYLVHVGLCLIYHSYLLQACFRFFRIIYYTYKQLFGYRSILRIIVVHWLLGFLFMTPNLILGNFQYALHAHHCLILYPNILGLFLTTSIIFYLPMIIIGSSYFYILYYIHRIDTSSIHMRRQQRTQRDVIVLHRIVSLVGLLLILSVPAIFLWIIYMITGHLYYFSYHLQWLTFALSLSILSFVSVFLTPQLQELLFEPVRSTETNSNTNNVSKWTETCELRLTDAQQ